MEPLEALAARRKAIAAARAKLDSEEADLDVAERVWRNLYGGNTVLFERTVPISQPQGIGAVPSRGLIATAANLLPEDGSVMPREDFKRALEAERGSEMTDNAFVTMLSRMTSAGLIEREGRDVRRKQGGVNVSLAG